MAQIKRRDFLKISGVAAAMMAGYDTLFAKTKALKIEDSKHNYPNAKYTESFYSNEFNSIYGDKKNHWHSFQSQNNNGNTLWEVWSNNNKITRETQSIKEYKTDPKIPDMNPKGCNKGAQYSQMIAQKDTISYPIKRVGKRGEGNWKQVSWDEATEEIAQNLWNIMTDPHKGPSKVMIESGESFKSEISKRAVNRFATQLGAVTNDIYQDRGSRFSGVSIAYGQQKVANSYELLYEADTAIFWGSNPNVTDIENAHFIWEAKYNGANIVVITPEFNATAKSADLWIPIKAGSDDYLAMSILYELITNNLYQKNFIKFFTDLTFLVDIETKTLLRRSRVDGFGDEEFYCMDKNSKKITLMPGSKGSRFDTLDLTNFEINPELEGEWEISIKGKDIKVTTVFELLKKEVLNFSPKITQKKTGIHPSIVQKLSLDIANSKKLSITIGSSLNKYFNGVLSTWNISSICGLTGHMGPNGGIHTDSSFTTSKLDYLNDFKGRYKPRIYSKFINNFFIANGFESNDLDKQLKKAHKPYYLPELAIVVAKGSLFGNKSSAYKDALFSKLKYLVCIDTKMSYEALHADIVLPAKNSYESWDIQLSLDSINISRPILDITPATQGKDEWDILELITSKLENIANKPENIDKSKIVEDASLAKDGFRDMRVVHKEFIEHGSTSKEVLKKIENMIFKENSHQSSNSFVYNVENFKRLNTSSGRQTFYIDHPIYIKMNANTNTAMPNIDIKTAKYPFSIISPHSRWSLNSTHKTSKTLLRLQRATPIAYINNQVANSKNIKDGDKIRVYNKIGSFKIMAKVSSSCPIDGILVENGWLPYMFDDFKTNSEVIANSINLLEVVDGWGHLCFGSQWDGNIYSNDSLVDFEKAGET